MIHKWLALAGSALILGGLIETAWSLSRLEKRVAGDDVNPLAGIGGSGGPALVEMHRRRQRNADLVSHLKRGAWLVLVGALVTLAATILDLIGC